MRTAKALLRYLWYTAVTLAVVSLWGRMFGFDLVSYARAAFNPSPQVWSAAYELDPTATDPVSQGDDHLRQAKNEVRRRLTAEHDFSTVPGLYIDTGRHIQGSARVFNQNTAPTVDGTFTPSCLFGTGDTLGFSGCDDGRLWIDKDGPDNVAGNADDRQLYVCTDADADRDCDSWLPVFSGVPTGSLILWDQSNTCPAGYTEATEFRNLRVMGADRAAADTGIPDDAGVSCSGAAAPAGCGAVAGTENYNFTQSTGELNSHSHTIPTNTGGTGLGTGPFYQGATGAPNYALSTGPTNSNGSSQADYGPLRTVLFCRRS